MQLKPFSDSVSLRLLTYQSLTLLHIVTRWPVLQKVRGHPALNSIDKLLIVLPFTQFSLILRIECRTPTAYRHGVSGSFSLPSRGSFHLSLTVLFSIGHRLVFSLGRWSSLLPTGFLVSRGTLDHIPAQNCFAYRTITFFGSAFQPYSTTVFKSL